jgi:hypothetical protein
LLHLWCNADLVVVVTRVDKNRAQGYHVPSGATDEDRDMFGELVRKCSATQVRTCEKTYKVRDSHKLVRRIRAAVVGHASLQGDFVPGANTFNETVKYLTRVEICASE